MQTALQRVSKLIKFRKRSPQASGRHTPNLWPVPVAAATAVLTACAGALLIYVWLRHLATPAPRQGHAAPADALDLVKTTLTVAAFVGAVLAGVYAYRKQRLDEGDARRADEAHLAERYATAAEQLGHEKAAVRMAGVYAMARLADDWQEQRQTCIEVICAYLRMPYETDPTQSKYREGEQEIRRTLIRVIRNHLRPGFSTVSWCGSNLSFEGAVFDRGDLTGSLFTGGHVSFHGAKFVSGVFYFNDIHVNGAHVSFSNAQFMGGEVRFRGAKFSGGSVTFSGAQVSGGSVTFSHATHTGGGMNWGPFPPLP